MTYTTSIPKPSMAVPRVAVVGGGIMGGMTAASLRLKGADVTLFDPHPMGTGPGASIDTGRSFRVHYGQDDTLMAMALQARRLWGHWSQEWGTTLLHGTSKVLVEKVGDASAKESWKAMRRLGLPADRRSRAELDQEWPGFVANMATIDRLGGVLDPSDILARLSPWLRKRGVRFKGEALDVSSQWVASAEGKEMFDVVVLTAGAWTQQWLKVPMKVTRQELVYFDATSLGSRLERLPVFSNMASGFYAIPTVKDGRIKVANHHPGLGGHPDGDDRKVAPEFEARARQFLSLHLPDLSDAHVMRRYVCFYSGTADRDFILDQMEDGMVLGCGFSGHGFKFAPLIGETLANMALGLPSGIPLDRFSIHRPSLRGELSKLAV
jgi:glycine/D-amino acid oxidase-like deaminating enzyme